MAVPIQPLDEYIVVQTEEAKSKTAAGLLLPESSKEKPKVAKVVAVGSAVKNLKVGDRILYQNSYEATEVSLEGEDYIILFHKNVIAIVK